MLTRCWLAMFAYWIVSMPCSAASAIRPFGVAENLQPTDYRSPSTEYVLRVNPSSRRGAGEAQYTLRRNGKLVWQDTLPFTLWDAVISNTGRVGGYGYSHGYNDGQGKGVSMFLVAILDEHGKVLLNEQIPRERTRAMHSTTEPKARGLFFDPLQDRMMVQVDVHRSKDYVSGWWVYSRVMRWRSSRCRSLRCDLLSCRSITCTAHGKFRAPP